MVMKKSIITFSLLLKCFRLLLQTFLSSRGISSCISIYWLLLKQTIVVTIDLEDRAWDKYWIYGSNESILLFQCFEATA